MVLRGGIPLIDVPLVLERTATGGSCNALNPKDEWTMKHLGNIAQVLLLGLAWLHSSHAACTVKSPPGLSKRRYPDIRSIYKDGYKMAAESNNATGKATWHAYEYYDVKTSSGLMEFLYGDEFVKVYYQQETNEAFFYTDSTCNTFDLDKPPKDLERILLKWTSKQGNATIFGVSSLFVNPLAQRAKVAFQGNGEDIRGIATLKWSICLQGEDQPIDVYFSDPKGHATPGGSDAPVPLRIVQGKEVTDVMVMEDYVDDPEEKFKIPTGLGCLRRRTNLPKPPSFANKSFVFHSEVMFRNLQSNSDFYYSSHLDIIRDISSMHMSAIVEPWETSEHNQQKTQPENTYQEIYDFYNKILYRLDNAGHRETCKVSTQLEYKLNVALPGLDNVDMMQIIFVDEKTLMNASYLGVHQVRGMPTKAFELVYGGFAEQASKISQVIITYYYLVGDLIWDEDLTVRNIPVKISAKTFTTEQRNFKPFYEITLNIHDLTTNMDGINKKMDVQACYEEDDQSYTWLQVGFPLTGDDLATVINRISTIREKFLRKLYEVTGLTPLRVPRTLVDFTDNMVFVTSLILERPAIMDDYNKKENYAIKSYDYAEAVIPLRECLRLCTSPDNEECSAVAYCGASCYTTRMYSEGEMYNIEKSVDCNLYAKNELGKMRKLNLSLDAVQNVKNAVKNNEFVVVIPRRQPSGALTMIAETMDDSVSSLPQVFGASDRETRYRHMRNGPEVSGFDTTRLGVHVKPTAATAVHVGTFAVEDCADICRDRDDCLAFSSCLVTNECVLSTERTPSADAVETQTACSIFSKAYKDSFNVFEGMSLDMKARKFVNVPEDTDCARLCLSEKEFDCKSFDYCSMTRDPNTVCRLHATHLREHGDPAKLDAKNAEKCFHYSKKYLYDFKKQKNQRFTGRQPHTVIKKVSAEECARQCWEASYDCKEFDFCSGPRHLGFGDCIQYERSDQAFKTTMSPVCSTYSFSGSGNGAGGLAYSQSAMPLHSNGTAGGLSFFMIVLGSALGVAALFGYRYYKAQQANRV